MSDSINDDITRDELRAIWRAHQRAKWCDRSSDAVVLPLRELLGEHAGWEAHHRMCLALCAPDDPLAERARRLEAHRAHERHPSPSEINPDWIIGIAGAPRLLSEVVQ